MAGVYLPVAALALIRRAAVAPAQQLAAFLVAAVACVLFAAEPENLEYVGWFSVPVILLLLLQPARRGLLSFPRPDRATMSLAFLAAGPALAYAVANVRLSAATPFSDTLHGGYLQAAILAVGLVLATAVAAGGAPGWQIAAGCVLAAAAMLGVAGVLFPQDPSSVGRPGGLLVLVGAASLAGLSCAGKPRIVGVLDAVVVLVPMGWRLRSPGEQPDDLDAGCRTCSGLTCSHPPLVGHGSCFLVAPVAGRPMAWRRASAASISDS